MSKKQLSKHRNVVPFLLKIFVYFLHIYFLTKQIKKYKTINENVVLFLQPFNTAAGL